MKSGNNEGRRPVSIAAPDNAVAFIALSLGVSLVLGDLFDESAERSGEPPAEVSRLVLRSRLLGSDRGCRDGEQTTNMLRSCTWFFERAQLR
jgi:hypothetical protein